jgi:hypothetical protein
MSEFMKQPCKNCPFRKDVKPFLHPERGADLAYASQNPYNTFPCHVTTEHSDGEDGSGEMLVTCNSKECAGFLTLQHNELGETSYDSEGFEPSNLVYNDSYEMASAYENLEDWEDMQDD